MTIKNNVRYYDFARKQNLKVETDRSKYTLLIDISLLETLQSGITHWAQCKYAE